MTTDIRFPIGPITGPDGFVSLEWQQWLQHPEVLDIAAANPIDVQSGGTGLASGTSGGILAFVDTNELASSGVLSASRIVLGGGAGATPATPLGLGTTTTLLHGNATGAPTWAAVNLAADVTGRLPYANIVQGSALSVLGVTGNAIADLASIVAGTDNQVLRRNGTAVAFGSVNLASSDAVTGTLAMGNGGTGLTVFATGTFTCANNATTTVNNANVTAGSLIFLQATNASAATLMGSTASLYISARTAATSFAVTTGSGAAAAGTETFNYVVMG